MSLRAISVQVRYGARLAVAAVSLTAAPGEVLVLLGANGSGKSSLLRALAGQQRHQGQIERECGSIGYLPQDAAARPALSVFEIVLLGRLRSLSLRVAPADLAAAEAALQEMGVADLAQRRLADLSGGQRQMVLLAQVLAGAPGCLLLDEPTSALDVAHQLAVLDRLVTVAVLHDLNAAARFADRVALLRDGMLLEIGQPAAVLTPDLLRAAYGVETAVLPGPDGRPVVVPLRVAGVA